MNESKAETVSVSGLLRRTSADKPHMTNYERAAQFAPFAALTGFGAAISETARLTDRKFELSDEAQEILNSKLVLIQQMLSDSPEITVVYFVKDRNKEGGKYVTLKGVVKRIDTIEKKLIFTDGTKIIIDDLYDVEGDIFDLLGFECEF